MTDHDNGQNSSHFVISMEGDIHGEDTPENRETVRRIHACVDACAGISTGELERGVVQEMRQMIAELVPILQAQQQQRQEDQHPTLTGPKSRKAHAKKKTRQR